MNTFPLSCIMLVDNNPDDNFFHTRIINRSYPSIKVLTMNSATAALNYIQGCGKADPKPDLILLDINMPGTNGWEFAQAYHAMKGKAVIIMLTTSENPDDRLNALASPIIADLFTKPLTSAMLEDMHQKYFL